MRSHSLWLLLIILAVLAGYWKLLYHAQFSILSGYESANQAYAWDTLFSSTIHKGHLPLWDPYQASGRSLIAEMQSGTFYPPKFLRYLWPLDRHGQLSVEVYHVYYLLTAVAGAWFLFLLARDLGLQPFPAYFAGIVFAIGGFVGRIVWPHLHDSAIWLPLLMLFALRALRAQSQRAAIQYSCAAGLAFGMTVLAGGLHLVIMQGLALIGLVAYCGFGCRECTRTRAVTVLLIASAVGVAAGAVQLWPSMEYAKLATRYLGGPYSQDANRRIPYDFMTESFLPRAIMGLFMAFPFGGGGEMQGTVEITPYLGLLPILLAMVGVWRNWTQPIVRYLTALAALSFSYAMGAQSLLNGVVYATVPFVWMAREPARFVHLTHFALAILGGFGAQSIFESDGALDFLRRPLYVLGGVVAGILAMLAVPAFIRTASVPESYYVALLQFILAFALLACVIVGKYRGTSARFLLAAIAIADLESANWTIRDIRVMHKGEDHLRVLQDSTAMADFFKAQRSWFRVHFWAPWQPSIGDVFGVHTTWGMSATALRDYSDFMLMTPRGHDMLGVRYEIREASSQEPGPVWSDKLWKVYEVSSHYFPRAWVVNSAYAEPSHDEIFHRLAMRNFNPEVTAVVDAPVDLPDGDHVKPAAIPATIAFGRETENSVEMTVDAAACGLLVLSETHYPGWHVSVNGKEQRLYRANATLRGVVLPQGQSQVRFWFAPRSVYGGGAITLLCFAGVLGWFAVRPVKEGGPAI